MAIASLVLAASRALQADVPESALRVEMLQRALLHAYRAQLGRPFRLVLAVSRDCFHMLTRVLASPWWSANFLVPTSTFAGTTQTGRSTSSSIAASITASLPPTMRRS